MKVIKRTEPAGGERAMKFIAEDNGNCRVYYRSDRDRSLYCWQLDRPGLFKFFRCSKDGEPSHEMEPPNETPLPPQETSIGRELTAFLTSASTTMTYYVCKTSDGFFELRQERFRQQANSGKSHPHDVCAVARSIDEMKDMVKQHFKQPVDWSAIEPEYDEDEIPSSPGM